MTDDEQKRIISENLSRLIKQNGIDQRKICADLDIKPTTLSQWVRGKANPSLVSLRDLAEYFGVSVYDIIEPEPCSNSLNKAIQPYLCDESIKLLSKYKRAPEYVQKAIWDLLRR